MSASALARVRASRLRQMAWMYTAAAHRICQHIHTSDVAGRAVGASVGHRMVEVGETRSGCCCLTSCSLSTYRSLTALMMRARFRDRTM